MPTGGVGRGRAEWGGGRRSIGRTTSWDVERRGGLVDVAGR